jgi:DNA-binding NarL/FixJ family response regulator
LNKQVGFELGISEITVKAHRGKVVRKMKADSLAGTESLHLSIGHRSYRPTQTAGKSLQRAGAPLLDQIKIE